MAYPHHEDLDLARDKESSIWGLKLTKEFRNDMGLASTYLLEPPPPNLKKSNLKSSLLFLLFLDFRGGPPLSKQCLVRRRKKWVYSFYQLFLGVGGRPNHLWKFICRGGSPSHTGEGVTYPYKWIPTVAPLHLLEWVIFLSIHKKMESYKPFCSNTCLYTTSLRNIHWARISFGDLGR